MTYWFASVMGLKDCLRLVKVWTVHKFAYKDGAAPLSAYIGPAMLSIEDFDYSQRVAQGAWF